MEQLTPTQRRIYDVLKDGWEHPVSELLKVIDDQAELNHLRVLISGMRPKLDVEGLTIVARERSPLGSSYRLARWIDNEE